MKKLLWVSSLILLSTLGLHATSTAEQINKTNCSACHMLKSPLNHDKMKTMSKKDRMSMKEKMMKTMKAPPMSKVSAKLKFDFKNDKNKFVAFVKDYIVNPSADKSHCMPMALKKFGLMPAMGKSLNNTELNVIANWLHDNFKEKWDRNDKGMLCNKNAQNMKCSHGKCGNKIKKDMNKMKCNAGKCGGSSKQKMDKCGL